MKELNTKDCDFNALRCSSLPSLSLLIKIDFKYYGLLRGQLVFGSIIQNSESENST